MDERARVVEDVVTSGGLRQVHVVSMDGPVDVRRWVNELAPGEAAAGDVQIYRVHEADVGVHHAWLVWHAREVVEIFAAGDGGESRFQGVMWWVGPEEGLRYSIDVAAAVYRAKLGRWPVQAWVRKLPRGATAEVAIDGLYGEEPEVVALGEAGWVPPRFVVLAGGVDYEGLGDVVEMPERACDGGCA